MADDVAEAPEAGLTNRPITIAAGHGVKIKIWQNKGASGDFHSVKIERSYKDGEEWKVATSLGVDDLLPAARALEKAYDQILELQQKRGRSPS